MANFFVRLLYRVTGSKLPTSLLHWSDIDAVTVMIDADAPDAGLAEEAVHKAFGKSVKAIVKVNARKHYRVRRDTQVLLSLLPYNNWKSEYFLRRSKAVFKIGRIPLPVLDLVVSDPEGQSFPQTEVLDRMVEIIKGLK